MNMNEMKSRLRLLLLIVAGGMAGMLTLQGCSDDDDSPEVPDAVTRAFSTRYPSASNETWEIKQGYYVAEFRNGGKETEAWFTPGAEWAMTETDYGKSLTLLPTAVQTAFGSSEYATWQIDDIDCYERPDNETFYLIEVETGGQRDRDLFYRPDGTLIKNVEDTTGDDDDVLPDTVL